MKVRGFLLFIALAILASSLSAQTNQYYPSGRAPLLAPAYVKLPFGAVRPLGWIDTVLILQRNALTGHLDEICDSLKSPSVLRTGDEYLYCYYEGLVQLGLILNDTMLLRKANAAMNYFIGTPATNGNFYTTTSIAFDHLCIIRCLMTMYEFNQDSRVLPLMTNYFHYFNGLTPTFNGDGDMWSLNRLPEFMPVAQWLYNRTGDSLVLQAVTKRVTDTLKGWVKNYTSYPYKDSVNATAGYPILDNHNVNISEAFKYALYYLQSKDSTHRDILMDSALAITDKWHGSVGGRFDADEHLNGKQPTRGMECCGITEMSWSMEQLFEGFGKVSLADRAEWLMFNCFAGTNTADMWGHQYDQQANQVMVNKASRPWNGNDNTSNLYGLRPNWACCMCNVHATWPRYLEHMWAATQDNGLIVSLYGPCQVTALAANDSCSVTITETTEYPWDGTMGFKLSLSKTDSFPLYFRIPTWENNATIKSPAGTASPAAGTVYKISRTWHTGDSITLSFSMGIRTENRWNNGICVMRGPLWYSLKIGETWKQLATHRLGSRDWEIDPTTAWNVALKIDPLNPAGAFQVVRNPISRVPFAQKGEQVYLPGDTTFTTWAQDPPVVLKAQGRILPSWTLNSVQNANDPPASPLASTVSGTDTSIELIPYGSAKLRTTVMPWINTPVGVHSSVQVFADKDLEVNAGRTGKCLFTVRTPGAFDLTLVDMAGRTVFRRNAEGPLSFVLEKGVVGKGSYIVHLAAGNKRLQKKILLVQ